MKSLKTQCSKSEHKERGGIWSQRDNWRRAVQVKIWSVFLTNLFTWWAHWQAGSVTFTGALKLSCFWGPKANQCSEDAGICWLNTTSECVCATSQQFQKSQLQYLKISPVCRSHLPAEDHCRSWNQYIITCVSLTQQKNKLNQCPHHRKQGSLRYKSFTHPSLFSSSSALERSCEPASERSRAARGRSL